MRIFERLLIKLGWVHTFGSADVCRMSVSAGRTGFGVYPDSYTRWRNWLRHCTTSQKVAGPIPDGVIGIFRLHNPSGRTMAPGVDSASNGNEYQEYFLGVKAAGA